MALIGAVPPLPRELGPLAEYLRRRDTGPPSRQPLPVAIEQTTVGILELDRIAWAYVPTIGLEQFDPDGFVVWWQDADTTDPTDGGVRVSASSRAFSMLWPSGSTRSYAVAAFRQTWQGEQLGPKQQHETWRAAT